MADILDSANTQGNSAAQIPQGSLIVPAEPEVPPTVNPPEPPPPPIAVEKHEEQGKNHKGVVIALSLLFVFLTTGLVFVFVNQQQSLNDIRNKAADGDLYPTYSECTNDPSKTGTCSCTSGYSPVSEGSGYRCKLDTLVHPTWMDPEPDGSCRQGYTLQYDGSSQRCHIVDTTTDRNNCGTVGVKCMNGYNCEGGECTANTTTDTCGRNTDTGAPICCTDNSCSGGEFVCEGSNRLECKTGNSWCTIDADGCIDNEPKPTNPPHDNDNNTPTPTKPVTAQCTDITIYKDGVVVTPSTLLSGDAVVIAVRGDNATRARIRVNGGAWTETTTTNASGEYTLSYTLPAGVTNFTIESEIYGVDGVWK